MALECGHASTPRIVCDLPTIESASAGSFRPPADCAGPWGGEHAAGLERLSGYGHHGGGAQVQPAPGAQMVSAHGQARLGAGDAVDQFGLPPARHAVRVAQ